nr:hypothetical protein [Novosphingobium sp. NBM11]
MATSGGSSFRNCAATRLRTPGVNSNTSRSSFNCISTSVSRSGPRGRTGSVETSCVISAALPVKGRIRNSALRWRVASAGHWPSSSSVSTIRTSLRTRVSGWLRRVTSVSTPNAPRPTRAA